MEKQMTCSWCDEKIPLCQRFRRSRYCSIKHRDEEFEHLKKLGIKIGSQDSDSPKDKPK